MVVTHPSGHPLKIVFSLVAIAVEEKPSTHLRTERTTIPFHGAVSAEEATTDHAGLQLKINEGLATSRTWEIVVSFLFCHIR
jgi:hypothetical protein